MATERELKYDLDPATLDGDRASVDGSCQSEAESDGPQPVDLDGLAVIVGPSRTITLVADYWDTPSGRLRAWGVTMRHRSASDGSEAGWTVKVPVPGPPPALIFAQPSKPSPPPGPSAAVRSRREIDVPGTDAEPPGRVLAVVSGLVGDEALCRVARVTTFRTSTDVAATGRRPGFDPGVRTDEDLVIAEVPDAVERFGQLEIESTGDDALLAHMAHWADDIGLVHSAAANKLERALGPSTDVIAASEPLDARSSLRTVVQSAISVPLRSMLAVDALLRDDVTSIPPPGSAEERWHPDPSAWRVAQLNARRLRDLLVSLRPQLHEPLGDSTLQAISQFVGLLDDLDDAHTIVARLRPLGETNPFTTSVEVEFERAGRALSSALHSPTHREMLASLETASSRSPYATALDGSALDQSATAASLLLEANAAAWLRLEETVDATATVPAGSKAADAAVSVALDATAAARAIAELSAPVLGTGATQAAERLGHLESELTARRDAVMFQHWIEHFVVDRGASLDSATAFRAGELHMAARLDPARADDWHPVWDRARKRRPSRW